MKRLSQLLAVAVVAFLVPLGISAPASAVPTCGVGFTGPNTENKCTFTETYQCTVQNGNTVTYNNTNSQIGQTGDVIVAVNTTGGSGTSGSVTNTNGTTFNVVVDNGTTCTATVTVPATETPETVQPTQPTQPGQGQQASAPIRSLPVTSGGSSLFVTAVVAAAVALSAVVAAGSVLLYRHFHTS